MMTETSLCIYIAAVMILTVIPIHGESERCKNDFTLVDEKCYRLNSDKVTWAAARDNCNNWNGKLATFTSFDQLTAVAKAFDAATSSYVWISSPNEFQEKEFKFAASFTGSIGNFAFFSEVCGHKFQSLCIGTIEAKTGESTSQSGSVKMDKTMLNNETQKVTCLSNDSVLVDGQCYRSSTEEMPSSLAKVYCGEQKETLATITSIEQGIKVLKLLNVIERELWVESKFGIFEGSYAVMYEMGPCRQYEFGISSFSSSLPALCMKPPIPYLETTTTPASTASQGSSSTPQGNKKLVNKNGLQLVKKVSQKTRIDYDTNFYFYEK